MPHLSDSLLLTMARLIRKGLATTTKKKFSDEPIFVTMIARGKHSAVGRKFFFERGDDIRDLAQLRQSNLADRESFLFQVWIGFYDSS
jgi:hypothetical protein